MLVLFATKPCIAALYNLAYQAQINPYPKDKLYPKCKRHVGSSPIMHFTELTWLSLAMLVVSLLMALAMPKSMSLSCPSTMRKLAGFRSECTILAS